MIVRKYWVVITLAAISVIALLLRVYHLDWQCLTPDEHITSYIVSYHSFVEIIPWSFQNNYNPPLYFLLAKLSALVLGINNFSLRFPSMILGVLAIPLAYITGREFYDDFSGLLLAGFIAISYPFIYYSQNARPYMLVFCAFLAFIYFYIKVWRGDLSKTTLFLIFLSGAICIWSHYYSVIPVGVAIILLAYRNKLWRLITIGLMLFIPLLIIVFPVVLDHFIYLPIAYRNIFWATPYQMAIMLPVELFGWACFVVIPLAIISIVLYYKDRLLLSMAFIGTVTILSCIPMTEFTAMSPRYALLVAPLLLMVAFKPLSKFAAYLEGLRKFLFYSGLMYLFGILTYGALLSWYTFNTCPYF